MKKKKHKNDNDIRGVIEVSTLEGYSFEGWKRFFMEALLYIEQRYYHTLSLDLTNIPQKQNHDLLTNGIITFGPNMNLNTIYGILKNAGIPQVTDNIIALYQGVGNRDIRLQIGGYEQSYARGSNDGVLFYDIQLETYQHYSTIDENYPQSQYNYWLLPINNILCTHESNSKHNQYNMNINKMYFKITLQNQFIVVPEQLAQQIERSFQTEDIECTMKQQLQCKNMNSIDLSLNYIAFRMGQQSMAFINISLYELRDIYDVDKKITSFFIKTGNIPQIGTALFKSHYIALDLTKHSMIFSRLKKYQRGQLLSGVTIIRMLLAFGAFLVLASAGVFIWQKFSGEEWSGIAYGTVGNRVKLVCSNGYEPTLMEDVD